MLNIPKLLTKPKSFHSLIGLSPDQFNNLLKKIKPLWQKAEFKRKNWEGRQRRIGGGRKARLSLEQTLFLLLLYYRTYVNHVFLGMIGNINDSKICKYFSRLNPLLAQVFRIPQNKVSLSEDEILEIILDATEQSTERRKGSGYSGKKKQQTVKTQICIDKKGKIIHVTKSYSGNIHDKKIYDKQKLKIPKHIKIKADLGYVGTRCETPVKKPKSRSLTMTEEQFNREFNSSRIIIEHVFAHLKKFHILKDRFRNNISTYNLIFKNICGIRNMVMA